MPRKAGTSAKAHRDHLRDHLRSLGCSVAPIAAEMARRFDLRPRLAWRHALGWPQWKVAQRYNTLHPGARLSDTRVSDYENWPQGGHPPSPRYLAGLAATYGHGCTPALLVDAEDLEHLTPADRTLLTNPPSPPATAAPLPPAPVVAADPVGATVTGLPDTLAVQLMTYLGSLAGRDMLSTPRERDRAYDRLVQFLQSWAHTMHRRDALQILAWAATAAAALPALDSDAHHRVLSVLTTSHRVDTPAIEHIEAVLWHCRRQDHALGPQAALDTVLAQRDLARALLPDCPAPLRPRLLSALSEASRQAGWLSFDLHRFDHAGYYQEDARTLAHEAQNVGLGALVLCEMSYLATWRNMPRTGIDHAVAAGQWANQTDDTRLRAYAADVLARAYAADGQRDGCLTALETAHITLSAVGEHAPSYVPLYDEALHISFCGMCHLELRDTELAVDCARSSLETLNPSCVRDRAMTLIDLGTAYVQCEEIDEAARLFGDAGDISARNSSARLTERLAQGRAELEPWKHTAAVRQLDDRRASDSTA